MKRERVPCRDTWYIFFGERRAAQYQCRMHSAHFFVFGDNKWGRGVSHQISNILYSDENTFIWLPQLLLGCCTAMKQTSQSWRPQDPSPNRPRSHQDSPKHFPVGGSHVPWGQTSNDPQIWKTRTASTTWSCSSLMVHVYSLNLSSQTRAASMFSFSLFLIFLQHSIAFHFHFGFLFWNSEIVANFFVRTSYFLPRIANALIEICGERRQL